MVEALEKQGGGADILKLVNLSLTDDIVNSIMEYNDVIFVEEGVENGSISQKLGNILVQKGFSGKYRTRTLGNTFVPHQSVAEAFNEYGIDSENILKLLKE